jgi:hypothetical protein
VAIFLGELTNPLQSIWTIARKAKFESLEILFSPVFTIAFISIRVVILPPVLMDILLDYYHSYVNGSLQLVYAISWGFMSSSMTIGGMLWSWKLARGFFKKHCNKEKKQKKIS